MNVDNNLASEDKRWVKDVLECLLLVKNYYQKQIKMNKQVTFILLTIAMTMVGSCGGDDSPPVAGIVGSWELSEVIFVSESSTASLSNERLERFTLEFRSDSTIAAGGTGDTQVYPWSYNAEAGTFSVSLSGQDRIFDFVEDDEFLRYDTYETANMQLTEGEERQIVELAISTFIQRQTSYDVSAPLTVSLKFKRV